MVDELKTTDFEKKSSRNSEGKAMTILTIVFAIIFLLILAVSIAYLADFLIYRGTQQDGLLLTTQQRVHGIFHWFNK
ncbi:MULTISPECIES: hypothetical protein [unclassified Mycoplasma]|uniref:hypothetical protein n=1 Tax=unclassified Mycoplasma TaxID=2683645 RepID=UPI00216B5EE1|nr:MULTISPECIES: hypothetical protein [unclassified Mycoplasma]MCS4536552.1 hypothetical protein [Mycoplasma sp. CSL7475-4]MCT4469629.1 hypothetical protein [Mycoplasma sp. HS2188]